ncbi:Putative aminopeptidase YsdC [Poriferisphaera corsica]|uniref:Aminopeptidase YsdC n=1 Tax=Poriferisphaera corsica TaxID=2528020 RepID=A0A517YXZ5_9BACT|nr:M20/M25/M40 family metallo-hydrolase [Poriferisphaera corsica]QDU35095.1 Putative aminopeptidase YsdC [Poriferisphaera corsica]
MNTQLLEQLTTTAGVAGREHRIRQFILDQSANIFDETHVDNLGNLHGIIKPKSSSSTPPQKIMIAAHMDQIGFFVRFIDSKGLIYLQPVGGFDPRNLFARTVTICPDVNDPTKDVIGVMNPAGKPIHIADEADKKKIPDVSEFIVDTGLTPEDVNKQIKIGDMVVLNAPLLEIGDLITAQCLDNRVSAYIAIQALSQIKNNACEIHMVFTVQEEVGLRGAGPATTIIKPDIGICLDTTICCDLPGVPEKDRASVLGQGIGLNVMDGAAIVDHELMEHFASLAEKHSIKAQRTMLYRGGTDAGTMQRAHQGFRIMTLLTPVKHIHTVTETIHRDDVESAIQLLTVYLESA